jgi:hypothetical protein
MIAFIRTENTDGTMNSAVALADQEVAIAAAITIEKRATSVVLSAVSKAAGLYVTQLMNVKITSNAIARTFKIVSLMRITRRFWPISRA